MQTETNLIPTESEEINKTETTSETQAENTIEPIENQENLVKEYFYKGEQTSIKNLATLFGQSEIELIKEFGAFKAKKTYKKFNYFIDTTSIYKDEMIEKIKTAKKQQFNAVCVFPPIISLAKSLLVGSAVKVRALINYPYGEENIKTLKYAVKQAIKQGADEIIIAVSTFSIKNGGLYEFLNLLKKLIKKYKNKNLSLIVDSTSLSATDVEGFISKIKGLGIYSLILKSDCVIDKNRLIDALSVLSDDLLVESFSSVSTAEDAISLLLSGIAFLNASNCTEIVNDLSVKISGIKGEDCQSLDKEETKEYN